MAETTPETSMEVVAGGSMVEAIGGIGAVVLAILGLSRVLPMYMAAAATIIVGGALMLEGTAIVARYNQLARRVSEQRQHRIELGGGVSAEFIGGLAGIVLGILALVGIAPLMLVAIANIVFGAALLIGAGATQRLNALGSRFARFDETVRFETESVSAASGASVLVGMGAAVLGILAVLGMSPLVLDLIGLLSVGAAVLMSGSAITAKMISLVER